MTLNFKNISTCFIGLNLSEIELKVLELKDKSAMDDQISALVVEVGLIGLRVTRPLS